MENVNRYTSFFKRIATAPAPIRARLLLSSNIQIITAIAEIVYNIINKNIPVPAATLKKLKKFKKVYYKVVKAKPADRKQILISNPNCLPPLVVLFK